MKKRTYLMFLVCLANLLQAQTPTIDRVNPTNWWVGMKNPKLQLLLHGKDLKGSKVTLTYAGVALEQVQEVENSNYLFVDLHIAPDTKAGQLAIILNKNGKQSSFNYELRQRDKHPQAITSKDFVYLIMPDRFSNADPSNDKFANMADTASTRKNPFLRHGGDLQGVQNHLDYLDELGVTTIWLNPVIENNQPQTDEGGAMRSAYHGYGFTDHYNVDKRLGGNDAYLKLVTAAHAKGMKVMQDAVYNHVGINHWILRDMPMKSWLNQWQTYTNTSYRDEPMIDLTHRAKTDFEVQQKGWFVPFLPDLNHHNPFVANYLIQHALWTVEYFGVDGWRVDTYQYNDLDFMNRCNAALYEEYPDMLITGENSVHNVVSQAYFARNNMYVPFKSNMNSANDFVLYHATTTALNESFDWGKGFNHLYSTLVNDFLYENPNLNMTFLDNHDENRFFSVVGEKMSKYQLGIGFLLTTRGIPQLYYGTEILMKNFKNPSDAEVRRDFPGGFKGDSLNKFLAANRTTLENQAFDFVKKLANYRKKSAPLQVGKLTHYLPQNGTYVYFRHTDDANIMIVMSQNEKDITLDINRFQESLRGYSKGKNVMTDAVLKDLKQLSVPAMSIQIIELAR
jgi:neopullulanase